MEEIKSRDNQKLKNWAKLKQKKFVDETNLVLLEGERLVFDAYSRGAEFEAVCQSKDFPEKFNCKIYKMPEFCLETLCQTKTPQGIVAVAKMEKKPFVLPTKNFLILDHLSDPGNFGTIIRCAVACDFQIYALNCVDFRNSKTIRSSMGTIFDADIFEITKDDLKKFKNFEIFSASMEGQSVFNNFEVKQPFGLVLGSEGHGLSDDLKQMNFKKVSLPMKNQVESLNVAVSGGILMYLLSNK